MRIPLSRVGEVEALLGRAASIPRTGWKEPEVQRDEPTAPSNLPKVAVTTPGVEASKCGDCGKMMARPLAYSAEHFRTCGKWKAPRVEQGPAF